jgi:hypothetical protein|tara:strand:+ start:4345 stop:4626 length:282 start_codon:yes stop_codon:yes gene_type:complete
MSWSESVVWTESAGKTSSDGTVSLTVGGVSTATDAIYLYNSHATTGAVVKLNDAINVQVFIPGGIGNYIKIPGSFNKYEVVTSGVTVYAFATG